MDSGLREASWEIPLHWGQGIYLRGYALEGINVSIAAIADSTIWTGIEMNMHGQNGSFMPLIVKYLR